MPSVKNPNGPSRNRLAVRKCQAKALSRKRSAEGRHRIAKVDTRRGARPGILPTSGPNAKISSKKARKLEKKLGYAIQRKMDQEGGNHGVDEEQDEEKEADGVKEVEMGEIA